MNEMNSFPQEEKHQTISSSSRQEHSETIYEMYCKQTISVSSWCLPQEKENQKKSQASPSLTEE